MKSLASSPIESGNTKVPSNIMLKVSWSFVPLKGNSPDSILYNIHPRAQRSEDFYALLSLIISGDT
jgi:hypothetical protein